MIESAAGVGFSTLQTKRDISGRLTRFTVPRSPIHSDGARIAGQSRPASLASPALDSALIGAMAAKSDYISLSGYREPSQTQPPDAAVLRPGAEGEQGTANPESEKTGEAGKDETTPGKQSSDAGDSVELDRLQQRDRDVRRHEQAHKAAGGQYAGAISYEYRQGPDGRRYAVGGEVGIDISRERDPAATAAKMRQVRAAALAPADPSSQDRAVAAEASKLEMEASRKMTEDAAGREGYPDGEAGADQGAATNPGTAPTRGSSADPVSSPSRESPLERFIKRVSGGAADSASPFSAPSAPYGRLDVTA